MNLKDKEERLVQMDKEMDDVFEELKEGFMKLIFNCYTS